VILESLAQRPKFKIRITKSIISSDHPVLLVLELKWWEAIVEKAFAH
jgi:hypothetical protein